MRVNLCKWPLNILMCMHKLHHNMTTPHPLPQTVRVEHYQQVLKMDRNLNPICHAWISEPVTSQRSVFSLFHSRTTAYQRICAAACRGCSSWAPNRNIRESQSCTVTSTFLLIAILDGIFFLSLSILTYFKWAKTH